MKIIRHTLSKGLFLCYLASLIGITIILVTVALEIFNVDGLIHKDFGTSLLGFLGKFIAYFGTLYLPSTAVLIYSFIYIRRVIVRRRRSFPTFEIITILVFAGTGFARWAGDYLSIP